MPYTKALAVPIHAQYRGEEALASKLRDIFGPTGNLLAQRWVQKLQLRYSEICGPLHTHPYWKWLHQAALLAQLH